VRAFFLLLIPSLGVVSVARLARAADGGAGPCTESSYGMPCDPGDGNACAGVCQPDFSKTDAPMACLTADAATLARLKLSTLDGIDCAPTSQPGTDCTHACSAGACVLKNAASGSACIPSSDVDGGLASTTVCGGACDGNGACGAVGNACAKYGRGELGFCLYTACNAAANTTSCEQFPNPTGTSCSSGDVCMTGETCTAQAACTGGTLVPNCTEPGDVDASLSVRHETDASDDAEVDAAVHPTDGSPSSSSGGGCSMTGPRSETGVAGALAFGLVAVSLIRRRSRG
jgi:hypothetical protein